VIIVDTSAWIEFLRDTGSPVCNTVDRLLAGDIAICDAISMEVLAGARSEQHLAQLRGLLARATLVSITADDYDQAAALYRTCRRNGETVRKMIDCLIAAVTIRSSASILQADVDFAALARHTPLALHDDSAT
jgi:predicted nucleic acid-binding protein